MDSDYYYYYFDDCNLINYTNILFQLYNIKYPPIFQQKTPTLKLVFEVI